LQPVSEEFALEFSLFWQTSWEQLVQVIFFIKGTGILLAVSIVYGYFETFKKEKE
jgi:hypothetical protein